MKVFAIRHKPTQRFMPVPKGKRGSGSSYWDPSDTLDGSLPRLFSSKRKASSSLAQWLRGRHEPVEETVVGDEFGNFCGAVAVGAKAVFDPSRIQTDMEIVTFEMKETNTHNK